MVVSILIITGGTIAGILFVRDQKVNSLQITYINHACMMIEFNGFRIYTDPSGISDDYIDKPADAIFITHDHVDHWELRSVNRISTPNTKFFGGVKNSWMIEKFNFTVLTPGDKGYLGDFGYEAFPMYNLINSWHPQKSNYTGFIFTVHGYRIYVAGDTDLIEEHKLLKNTLDVAIVPTPPEGYPMMSFYKTLDFISLVKPKIVIPYHFETSNLEQFSKLVSVINTSVQCVYQDFPLVLI